MSDSVYENFLHPQCAQQAYNNGNQQYASYTVPVIQNAAYNYDYMCPPQTYTPASYPTYTEPYELSNWLSDPRAVADIERGLKFTDKMETIEITSKDLSPASCCSNIDLLIPDFYKNCSKTNGEWYYGTQKYTDYPSCSQTHAGSFNMDDRSMQQKAYNQPDLLDYSYNYESKELFNFSDVNQESFPFSDVNNLTAEVSNDESDIIVEDSEDEVTDYSEDLERRYDIKSTCIICNSSCTPMGSEFYVLNSETPLTMSTQKPVFVKLTELVGTLTNQRLWLCKQCLTLINTIDNLQLKLEGSKSELLRKFKGTCKENNVPQIKTPPKRRFKNFCGLHSFRCKLCEKVFSFKKIQERHMLRHKLIKRYLCELCGRRFTKRSCFLQHLSRQHSESCCEQPKTIPAYSCDLCGKVFRTKTNLNEHKNYCSGNLPFLCEHKGCDKKFASSTKLKSHIKLKHDKKFVAICSICNIGFVKLSDYKSHKITHSTEKKFQCTKCEKSYKTLSNLNYHVKFHNEKLPFICTICEKGFMRKEYLEAHVNNHKGIKNFTCNFCGKKFVSQKNLDAHLKYHEGNVKKRLCNVCNKSISNGFEEHLRTHSNMKEFQCEHCSMKFNTKGGLRKHAKRKH